MLANGDYKNCIGDCAEEIFKKTTIHKGVILLSGATGLFGHAIVDCLLWANKKYGCNFRIIALARNKERAAAQFRVYSDREDILFAPCDVNKLIPEVGNVDYVIHGASNTHPMAYSTDPIGTIRTNVIGTEHMLEYARTHGCRRFVFLSSVEIYGENQGEKNKFDEKECGYLDCNSVRAGYPESKRLGESLCCAYSASYDMDIVIPRLCRVYGPTMRADDSKALSQFIRKAVKGENIVLKSEGKQYYSYIYVFDAVKALFYIIDKGKPGEAYNISSELSDERLYDLAAKLAKIAGTKVVFELPEETEKQGYSSATKAILDNEKLKKLGWKERYDINEGLQMTVKILKTLAEG
jgi:nucleoside-diphosphate-sugar epimerase